MRSGGNTETTRERYHRRLKSLPWERKVEKKERGGSRSAGRARKFGSNCYSQNSRVCARDLPVSCSSEYLPPHAASTRPTQRLHVRGVLHQNLRQRHHCPQRAPQPAPVTRPSRGSMLLLHHNKQRSDPISGYTLKSRFPIVFAGCGGLQILSCGGLIQRRSCCSGHVGMWACPVGPDEAVFEISISTRDPLMLDAPLPYELYPECSCWASRVQWDEVDHLLPRHP